MSNMWQHNWWQNNHTQPNLIITGHIPTARIEKWRSLYGWDIDVLLGGSARGKFPSPPEYVFYLRIVLYGYWVEEEQTKEQKYFQHDCFSGVKTKKMKNLRFTGRRLEVSEFLQPLVDFAPKCYYPSYTYWLGGTLSAELWMLTSGVMWDSTSTYSTANVTALFKLSCPPPSSHTMH